MLDLKFFTKDRIVGIVCGALGIAYLVMAFQLPATTMVGDPGPQIFPYLAGILMLASSVSMLLRKAPAEKEKPWMTTEQRKRMWSLFLLMVAYVAGMDFIGYTIPTFLMLAIMCYMFAQGRVKIKIWQCAVYGVVLTFVIYLLFTRLLSVRLPMGRIRALNFLAEIL